MKQTIVVAVSNPKRSIGKTTGVFDICTRAMRKLNVLEWDFPKANALPRNCPSEAGETIFIARCFHLRTKCSKETIWAFWPTSYANV